MRMIMRKKRVHEGARALEQSGAAAQIESNDGECAGHAEQAASRNAGFGVPPQKAEARPRPHNHRELGDAIFAAADPVKAGCELLQPGEERADPTRLAALRAFADWAYGKPDAQGRYRPPRIIWDIPGPPYEPIDPQSDAEGGEQ